MTVKTGREGCFPEQIPASVNRSSQPLLAAGGCLCTGLTVGNWDETQQPKSGSTPESVGESRTKLEVHLVASRHSRELAGPPDILEWKFGSESGGLSAVVP